MERGIDARVRVLALEQDDAVALERGVEQRRDRVERDAAQACELPVGHPDGGLQLEHALLVLDRHGDLLEPERVADAVADGVEHLVDRAPLGERGGQAQQMADGDALALGGGGLLGVLERQGGVLGHADDQVELLVVGPAAVGRLVDREDPEDLAGGRAERHEEGVLGAPGVGIGRGRHGRDPRGQRVLAPVVLALLDVVGAAALEPRVQQRRPVGGARGLAEQRLARVLAADDHDGLEVVPRRAVQVHDHGAEAEAGLHRACHGTQNGLDLVGGAFHPALLSAAPAMIRSVDRSRGRREQVRRRRLAVAVAAALAFLAGLALGANGDEPVPPGREAE